MNPRISIIIPHHNIPHLLQRCLESIPDILDVEVIVVDDNSSSDKVDFNNFPGLNRTYTKVFFTKEGKGAGYARNVGLKHATGKWLLFADADDYFIENAFERIKSYVNSSADMILFKALSVDSETLAKSNRNERINNLIDLCLDGRITPQNASLSVHVPWCRLISHACVKKNSITFDEVIASNDTMFTTKVTCLSEKIMAADDYLYVITYRKDSLWDQRKKNPDNYLARLEVQIRRNRYLSQYGYCKMPILGKVMRSYSFSFMTFLKALALSFKYNALFDGFSLYFKNNKDII